MLLPAMVAATGFGLREETFTITGADSNILFVSREEFSSAGAEAPYLAHGKLPKEKNTR
jgi:hypothetical protein